MDSDQFAQLLEAVEQCQTNLFLIRHLLAFLVGLLLGWVCFHDF